MISPPRSITAAALTALLSSAPAACQLDGGEPLAPRERSFTTADLVLDGESHQVALEETEEGHILEGDMIVTSLLVPELTPEDENVPYSLATTSQNLLWPGGVVYYTISPSLPNPGRVFEAMRRWSANTPIRFVRRTTQRDYVTFRPSNGCSAHIGRIGGQQFVNLASFCNLGLTVHEIGHTLGLFHEHTRSDRDRFVRVIWGNIIPGLESNFWKNGAARKIGPYDFASIMHYGTYELSRNGFATLLRRPNDGYLLHPQEKSAPSANDAQAIRRRYSAVACPLGDGKYCGGVSIGGQRGNLYQCTGGQLKLLEKCAAGCFTAPPGEPDRCARRCEYGDGLYCGRNGVAGDPGTLYRCTGGQRSLVEVCDAGCEPAEPGRADGCATSCPLGDGLYCGGNGIAGEKGTLYRCTGGQIAELERCEAGCFEAPPGEPDACNTSCPLGDGLYCGGVEVGGEVGSLYRCSSGQLTLVEVCADGCASQPPGTADRCN